MTPSISEIFSTGRKAARGVGLGWGHADEAGRAASWLWYHGVDGIGALAHLLAEHDTRDVADHCPLGLGTRICDLPPETAVDIRDVISPILLLSFAAELAKITQKDYVLRFGEATYSASTTGMFCLNAGAMERGDVVLSAAKASGTPLLPAPRRCVDETAWATLNAFAHRTYAPATEASRLSGAGAGLSDND